MRENHHGSSGHTRRRRKNVQEIRVNDTTVAASSWIRKSFSQARGQKRKLDSGTSAGQINLTGHSLSTRFLISVMHKRYYHDDPGPLLQLLGHISDWFGELYTEGVLHETKRFRFVLLGLKGDLVFQAEATSLNRSFGHIRKRALKAGKKAKGLPGCCWLCMAGTETVMFEDFSREASWKSSMPSPVPWSETPSIFRGIPHPPDLAAFVQIDLFHVLNMGVYKDYAASCLCLLLPRLGQRSQETNMAEMNAKLKVYLKEEKKRLHCQRLTLGLIGADARKSFSSGGWSKGQDSVVLMGFVRFLVERVVPDFQNEPPFKYMHAGAMSIHACMSELFAQDAFMPKAVAATAGSDAYRFLLCYAKLAEWCTERQTLCYNLVPKLHYLHHVADQLETWGKCTSASLVLNPMCMSTSADEDFVGHIARASRRVSPRLPHSRVLRRYLAGLADHLGLLKLDS